MEYENVKTTFRLIFDLNHRHNFVFNCVMVKKFFNIKPKQRRETFLVAMNRHFVAYIEIGHDLLAH